MGVQLQNTSDHTPCFISTENVSHPFLSHSPVKDKAPKSSISIDLDGFHPLALRNNFQEN